MVSNASILFISISLIIQFLFPIALVIYFYLKEKISIGTVFTGALVFLIFQIITRIPLLNAAPRTSWYQGLANNHVFLLYLLLAFTAGLFEESGRFLGFKFVRKIKHNLEWKSGLALGIGHGGLESMYIGIGNLNNLILSLMINAGTFDSVVAPLLPSGTTEYIKDQLISLEPSIFLAGGIERLSTIFIQIALSMVVLYSVKNKRIIYFILAIGIHTLVDLSSLYMVQYFGIWGTEIFISLLAVASIIFIFKSRKYLDDKTESQDAEISAI